MNCPRRPAESRMRWRADGPFIDSGSGWAAEPSSPPIPARNGSRSAVRHLYGIEDPSRPAEGCPFARATLALDDEAALPCADGLCALQAAGAVGVRTHAATKIFLIIQPCLIFS